MNVHGRPNPDLLPATMQEVFGPTSLDSVGITSREEDLTGSNLPLFPGLRRYSKIDAWRGEIFECLVDASMFSEAEKWLDCWQMGIVLRCPRNPLHIFFVRYHCDLRICTICGARFGARLRKRYGKILGALARRGRKEGKRLRFLTLTKKKGANQLTPKFVRDLMKRVGAIIREFFDGGLAVLEVGEGFNLHVHCIVFGGFVPQAKLSEAWLSLTGDSPVVDIRRVKGWRHALRYILKYISKPCDFKRPEDYVVYLKALAGTRRVHSYGVFYGIKSEEIRNQARCRECGAFLRYDPDLSRKYSIEILRKGADYYYSFLDFQKVAQA